MEITPRMERSRDRIYISIVDNESQLCLGAELLEAAETDTEPEPAIYTREMTNILGPR
jgi:hypothetical protein